MASATLYDVKKEQPTDQSLRVAPLDDSITAGRISDLLTELRNRLESIERRLKNKASFEQEFYSVSDAAEILGKAAWTVREWCRLGRINATKRRCGRGSSGEWTISAGEIKRVIEEGLMPAIRD